MHKLNYFLIFLVITFNISVVENKWIWPKIKVLQKDRSDYSLEEEQYVRVGRDREPTTKSPVPGQPQNDDIDDYTDGNDDIGKQRSHYIPPGPVRHPLNGGNYNGFGNYPQNTGFLNIAPNGILVGPGGPTGIIGRPPNQYPVGVANPTFPAIQGSYSAAYPSTQNFLGPAVNNNAEFPGYNGLNNFFGQYAYANRQHFAGAQFPSLHYLQQPQYTEGYGLANQNPNFNVNPQFSGIFNPNHVFGFDENPTQLQSKSANVNAIPKKVDNKITRNLKKS